MQLCEHSNLYNCPPCEIKHLKYVIEELQEENTKLNTELNNKIISEMETDELINQLQEENNKLNAIIKFADAKINHLIGSCGKGEKINMLV
jgi:predicted nuclease with TOPRIM domain